jgi:hypothetical protein
MAEFAKMIEVDHGIKRKGTTVRKLKSKCNNLKSASNHWKHHMNIFKGQLG